MTEQADKYVVVCNLAEGISEARKGAKAYVIDPNAGWGGERQYLYLRSRCGRMIRKWESRTRLENFRVKTLPPEHPFYETLSNRGAYDTKEEAQRWAR